MTNIILPSQAQREQGRPAATPEVVQTHLKSDTTRPHHKEVLSALSEAHGAAHNSNGAASLPRSTPCPQWLLEGEERDTR